MKCSIGYGRYKNRREALFGVHKLNLMRVVYFEDDKKIFQAIFDTDKQQYVVYKDVIKKIRTVYRYRDVSPYLT